MGEPHINLDAAQPAQIGKSGDFHQDAAAQNADPVADRFHLAQLMRAEKHRLAALLGLSQTLTKRPFHQRVQPAGGLIQHQQRRPGREGADQSHLLPIAGGIRPRSPVQVQLETLNQLGLILLVANRAEVRHQLQGLPTGQIGPQRHVGGHIRHMLMRRSHICDGVAGQPGGARGRPEHPQQQAHGGRLPRPIRTKKAEDLPRIEEQIEILQRPD